MKPARIALHGARAGEEHVDQPGEMVAKMRDSLVQRARRRLMKQMVLSGDAENYVMGHPTLTSNNLTFNKTLIARGSYNWV